MQGRVATEQAAARRQRWHTYHLMAAQIGFKNMPTLADFLGSDKAVPTRPQTDEEIERAGLAWHFELNARAGRPVRPGQLQPQPKED